MDVEEKMIAYCGMTCNYCYVHHKKKAPCLGCRASSGHQPASCRQCKIKACAIEKGIEWCDRCQEYPCKLINGLDKSYQTRYNESLINKSKEIKRIGLKSFLENEEKRLSCLACGGVINIHDRKCASCGQVKAISEDSHE